MAQIFYVHCPTCGDRFPCHPELWQVDYELLCPFCGDSFPQESSPLIITATGERRPGRDAGRPRAPHGGAKPARLPTRVPAGDEDPSTSAESM